MNTNNNYRKQLIMIALPIMLSNMISQVQMLIDKIFLGRLDIIYMSAVGNANSPMWTTMDLVFTVTTGSTILISQSIGKGDKERGYELTCSMFKYSSVFSFLLFAFWFTCARQVFGLMGVSDNVIEPCVQYARLCAPIFLVTGAGASMCSMLQNSERTQALVVYGIVRSGINVVLDYAMIFGHFGFSPMGIKGAAIATTLAEFIGAAVVTVLIIMDDKIILKPHLKDIAKATIKPYIESIKLGIPTALESFAWNIGNMSLIVLLNHVSDVAAGVYTIIFGVECLPVVAIGALGNATLTLCGQETGRKNYGQISRIARTAFLWSMGVATTILVCFILFPQTIMGWFTTDQAIIVASAIYLIIVGIDLFPKSANIIVGSAIRGYGDTRWMLYTQLFGTVFVISLASLMVFAFHAGMAELFCVVVADETVRCSINYFRLRRITSKNA